VVVEEMEADGGYKGASEVNKDFAFVASGGEF